MARPADLWRLLRMAGERTRSPEHYTAFQRQQGALICRYLADRGVTPPGRALDLGCGLGGYSLALRDAGFRVTSVDLDPDVLRPLTGAAMTAASDAAMLPFGDAVFDLVLCASLIEHVPAPDRLLREIHRVLRPGAACYLSFPPYYSPMGGHQFSPFHWLGERAALSIHRRLARGRDAGWRSRYLRPSDTFANAFGDYGLYRMTLSRARRLARTAGFAIVDRSVRHLPMNTTGWGPLGEVLTWHAQFLLRKGP